MNFRAEIKYLILLLRKNQYRKHFPILAGIFSRNFHIHHFDFPQFQSVFQHIYRSSGEPDPLYTLKQHLKPKSIPIPKISRKSKCP